MAGVKSVLFSLLLITQLSASFAVRSENTYQFNDNNVAQRLSVLEGMEDKNQALALVAKLRTSGDFYALDKLSILATESKLYHQLGQLDKAIALAQQQQSLANELGYKKLEANAYKLIGVYAYYQGNNRLALQSYQRALAYYLKVNEPIAQANLYNNIALVHAKTGQLESALLSYQQAQPLYQNHGSLQDQTDLELNVANLYLQLRRYERAITKYFDVIEKTKELGHMKGLAMAHAGLGNAYKYTSDYQQAEHYMLLALNYYRDSKNDYFTAAMLHNLAELNNLMSNIEAAITYAQEAIRLSIAQEHNIAYVGSLYSLAKAYFFQGKHALALNYLEQSSDMVKQMQYKEQQMYNFLLRALILAAQNKTFQAVQAQQQFLQLHIEMANNELNTKLALFDAEQLQQEVQQLKQQKRVQELETQRASQERNFIIIVVLAMLLIVFLIARREIERRSKHELELKVKQRTTELELIMQELQNANQIKSQFLANMSHEIRTPLTTVIGQAEAIISGDIDEHYIHKEVEIIHGNSLHLLELTNNILDLSKIEANKIELELKKQDLHDILQELANIFSIQAKKKGLTFEIIHALTRPFLIEIDGFRVKQILINLCANAIKFTAKGHVELKITQSDHHLDFKITDSGIGMSSSQLQHLFESFTQGDSSKSRRFGGTGLGLCLSDQLAKIMGAKITVESELNQGSVFVFSLPCKFSADQVAKQSKVLAENADNQQHQKPLQGTILLAEDHDDNRRLIARLLSSLGLEVLTARNGLEALALLEQHQVTLVLMDIQMPEMDGIEAFKVLRQRGYEIPVVALTANAMSHEISQYLALGFNGHLSKPIERQIFVATISQYYDGSVSLAQANEHFEQLDMTDLKQEFLSNLALEQQDLILHINNSAWQKLANLAHRIAGAAQMFGFAELSQHALSLEMAIKNNETLTINNHTQQLLNEIDQVLW
ncbi:Signal transduction histidine kinase [Colwellia chukchiensis]|uniref:histidine kinase n=1 Tax=Colwellia chukchiensis TaxID=641665 RepID=A0A1H7QC15_9GAMM|nr:response regulator [Colwellia chukchiensis]SEL45204.1 Signal transduction histidine kinase [Colwellia chukchiensis]